MGRVDELQWDAVALAPVCIQQSRHVGTHTHIHTLIWRNEMHARNGAKVRRGIWQLLPLALRAV